MVNIRTSLYKQIRNSADGEARPLRLERCSSKLIPQKKAREKVVYSLGE